MPRQLIRLTAIFAAACAIVTAAAGQKLPKNPSASLPWPNKTVRIIVGFPAGSSPDLENTAGFLAEHDAPEFQWDNALDVMWLHARLGGPGCSLQRPATALTHNLLRTLQCSLAETWLSLPDAKLLSPVLSLRIETTPAEAKPVRALLTIRFPSSSTCMQQWAQRIIRHAN